MDYFLKKQDAQKAIESYKTAIQKTEAQFNSSGQHFEIAKRVTKLADAFLHAGQVDSALYYYQDALLTNSRGNTGFLSAIKIWGIRSRINRYFINSPFP